LPAKAAQQIQTEIEQFKKQIPLIHAICEPGIRDRHWEEISKAMNVPIRYQDPGLNLKYFMDFDFIQNIEVLQEISERARREFQIETLLKEMEEQWETIDLDTKSWKETKT